MNKIYKPVQEEKTILENKPRILSGKEQDRMCENGWSLQLANFRETEEELYKRLKARGFTKVKIYYDTTCIKGYYDKFAMCKF